MIEIKEYGEPRVLMLSTSKHTIRHYQLFIDGTLFDKAKVSGAGEATEAGVWFTVATSDCETFERIGSYSYRQLPLGLAEFIYVPKLNWAKSLQDVWFRQSDSDPSKLLEIMFIFKPEIENWKVPYLPSEYFSELSALINATNKSTIEVELLNKVDGAKSGFVVTFPYASQDLPIISEFTRCSDTLHEVHRTVESTLLSRLSDDSVVMYFDFPAEVKVPCEQYLLYFAQFLKDLGVEADTALTHEAGQVLFTVTPNDKQQALDNIRTALEVYLHLPSSPVSDTQQSEIAILRLNSELQNFQSKLSLARAEIQMKEAAIQLQQVTIAQLTGEVVFDSLKDVTPKPKDKDKEELLGDVVSLIPLKGKGLEVNLPEIFRKLKRLFNKEE